MNLPDLLLPYELSDEAAAHIINDRSRSEAERRRAPA